MNSHLHTNVSEGVMHYGLDVHPSIIGDVRCSLNTEHRTGTACSPDGSEEGSVTPVLVSVWMDVGGPSKRTPEPIGVVV